MDVAAYNAQILRIYTAFRAVESYYGSSGRMNTLHGALAQGLVMLSSDVEGIITPDDGDPKTPKKS